MRSDDGDEWRWQYRMSSLPSSERICFCSPSPTTVMPEGKITALRAQANDTQRVNIFIDGAFALGVSLTTLGKANLYVGKEITQADFVELEQAEQSSKAYQAALRFLEARPRSVAEIRERLRRKEFDPESIELALTRLTDLGLVNDASFARLWVENRQTYRPRGPAALRNELRRKGVERGLIEQTLADEEVLGDSSVQALELARGVLHKYVNAPDRATFSRKLGGFLQRRGFGFDIVRGVTEQLWCESHNSLDDETFEEA